MQCPQCQFENREGRRFCAECGAPFPVACPDCGFANASGEKFCGGCGQGLTRPTAPEKTQSDKPPATGERRPVTVLFADLAGFTSMSAGLDPEEMHRILEGFFEAVDGIVTQYGGTVDKHMGDNVMAVFGAPVAHDDDPARAVRAAMDIHAAMPGLDAPPETPLQVHIGIASGQVVVGDTGSSHHREYTVIGDSVNLASRLEDMARTGETLVSDAVYRAVESLVQGEDAGAATVKGIDRPVRVWRLRGLTVGPRGGDRLPFIGRAGALNQFRGVARACLDAGTGQTILLRGEAGIGKTRLLEELMAIAGEAGFRRHRGLVLDFGVGKGRDAIRALVLGLLDAPAESGVAGHEKAADNAIASGALSADQRVFLNDLLDLPQTAAQRATYDAMDNDTRNQGKREILPALVKAASARNPVLLAVEDLHWADPDTLMHLAGVASVARDCPALLIMTTRIEGDPLDQAWREAAQGSELITIDLAPLRKEEALSLAEGFFDATNKFVLNCVERAGGNPLFLEQLLRNATEGASGDVPDSIQSLVLARMDRLQAVDRAALVAASVIGQRFDLAILRRLIGDASYNCAVLAKHYLVRPDGEGFLFAHALIRESVYASLLNATKRDLHGRAAKLFADGDAVLYAQHLDRAGDAGAPSAYLRAARAAAEAYRFDHVLELADRGLSLATDNADRFALVCLRGELLRDLGSVEDSIAAFRQATDLAEDDGGTCRAWIGIAAGMRLTDDYDEALAALEIAESAASRRNMDAELAQIHHLRGNLYFPMGRNEDCRGQHKKALEFAMRSGIPELTASALSGLGDAAYSDGRMKTAYRNFGQCIDVCREHGVGRVEVANRSMLGWTRLFLNETKQAVEDGLAAAETAAKLGHPRAEIGGRLVAAFALIELGEHNDALQELDRGLELTRRLGSGRFEAQILCFRTWIFIDTNRKSEALALAEESVAVARQSGINFLGPYILGCLSRATDDSETRQQAIREAEDLLAAGSVGHNFFWFYREAMQGALERGEWDEAERFAAALEDYTSAEPLPWSDFFTARARALAAHGRGKRSKDLSRELARLRDEADTNGFRNAWPELADALAEI